MGDQEHPDPVAPRNRSPRFTTPDWWIYRGTGRPLHDVRPIALLPPAPPWRTFRGGPLPERDIPPPDDGEEARRLGAEQHLSERDVDPREPDAVNAALYLRRPLLVTGRPGTGKSTLAYRIARELRLGRVLQWPITSRTTLKSGLYGYDPIGRVQAAAAGQAAVLTQPEYQLTHGFDVRAGPVPQHRGQSGAQCRTQLVTPARNRRRRPGQHHGDDRRLLLEGHVEHVRPVRIGGLGDVHARAARIRHERAPPRPPGAMPVARHHAFE